MSQVSYAAGTRFLSMIGGTILSFYDWYADMPIASPQVFGDQTDVPESGDWWNCGLPDHLGHQPADHPHPDAHFMTEARYRGQKVVVVSPDYSDHTKFADDWLAAAPGTDGALAMAMGHVVLTEFFRDRQVPYFTEYVKTYTDLPFLVTLRERDGASSRTGSSPPPTSAPTATRGRARTRRCCWTRRPGSRVYPNGSLGFRYAESGMGRWNLDLGGVDPLLTLYGRHGQAVAGGPAALRRRRQRGRRRDAPRGAGHAGGRPAGHDRVRPADGAVRGAARRAARAVADRLRRRQQPYTPAWQEAITSVPAAAAARVAREFARNAELSRGRSMIAMGAGTNHWFHSDQIYRTFFTLTMLCGCQGVNGGGWAHYVGQEKVRPLTGWSSRWRSRWTGSVRRGT